MTLLLPPPPRSRSTPSLPAVRFHTLTLTSYTFVTNAGIDRGATSENENWPQLTCDNGGVCRGAASNDWTPTEAALAAGLSIVVHDTPRASSGSGSKMICADLSLVDTMLPVIPYSPESMHP